MRVAFVLAAFAALWTAPAYGQAPQYPWCSVQRDADGGEIVSCGFDSRQQCQDYLMGVGGYCRQNFRYVATPTQPVQAQPRPLTPPAPREPARKPRNPS